MTDRALLLEVARGLVELAQVIERHLEEEARESQRVSASALRRDPYIGTGQHLCESCDETPLPVAVRYCKPCLDEAETELKELGY